MLGLMLGIYGFGLSLVFGCESLLRDLQIEPTLTLRTPGFQLLSAELFLQNVSRSTSLIHTHKSLLIGSS